MGSFHNDTQTRFISTQQVMTAIRKSLNRHYSFVGLISYNLGSCTRAMCLFEIYVDPKQCILYMLTICELYVQRGNCKYAFSLRYFCYRCLYKTIAFRLIMRFRCRRMYRYVLPIGYTRLKAVSIRVVLYILSICSGVYCSD